MAPRASARSPAWKRPLAVTLAAGAALAAWLAWEIPIIPGWWVH